MIREFEGIVVTETPYGESSKILNILTKENGIIGVMAKGAKRPKSQFRGCTSKCTYGKFNVYYHEKSLSTLISVDVIDSFYNIKNDIIKIGYLTYNVELAYQTVKQNDSKDIYKLLINTLEKIENNLNPVVMTNILEVKILDYLGVSMCLDRCSICGDDDLSNMVTVNGDTGGLVCKNCHKNEKIYDRKVMMMLKAYHDIDISSIKDLNINKDIIDDIDRILKNYYDRYTGLYLKSKEFLNEVK